MSDWNRYKNHFLVYDVWINESVKPFQMIDKEIISTVA